MSDPTTTAPPSALQRALLVAGIILIAVNLRPALAAVGPLVADIRGGTGLSYATLGLLTTLPLVAFGLFSAFASVVTRRLGIEGTLGAALVVLAGGILLRTVPSTAMLFVGTGLLGIAIAFGNVLLPSLVKRDFPDHSGVMTSVYSGGIGLGAALGAGLSVPLAESLGLGWRWALGAWAVPVLLALLVWLPQVRNRTLPRHAVSLGQSLKDLGRTPLAWYIALFMGLQSLSFYVVLAWLPDILQARGLGAEEAGWLLALTQLGGVVGTVAMPIVAERRDDQRSLVAILCGLEVVGIGGLLLFGTTLVALWAALLGFVLGATFGLALLFIVLRTSDTETATELSGMAQSVGYLVAATGPTLFGSLHDLTSGWTIPLVSLLAVVAAKLAMGLGAGKPSCIELEE